MQNAGVGISHLPNQRYRYFCNRDLRYNIMIVGPRGAGKTSLINNLFQAEILSRNAFDNISKETKTHDDEISDNIPINFQIVEVPFLAGKFNMTLTVTEVCGLSNCVTNIDNYKPILTRIDDLFSEYYEQEKQSVRALIKDHRIHVCIYAIDAAGPPLTPHELVLLRDLSNMCNVIPVVIKSDILLDSEVNFFFEKVCEQFDQEGITMFEPRVEDYKQEGEMIKPPYFVMNGAADNNLVKSERAMPWGMIDMASSRNNDFTSLRKLLVEKYMIELIENTDIFYESYKTRKLTTLFSSEAKLSEEEDRLSRDFFEKMRTEEFVILEKKKEYLKKKIMYEQKIHEQGLEMEETVSQHLVKERMKGKDAFE